MSSLSDLPQAPLFGVANEFFDALGVRQAIWHDGAWHERRIDSQKGAFHFIIAEKLEDGVANWRLPAQAEDGDIIEYCPKGEEIMGQLAHHIAHYGGTLLVIDYGKSGHKDDNLRRSESINHLIFYHIKVRQISPIGLILRHWRCGRASSCAPDKFHWGRFNRAWHW